MFAIALLLVSGGAAALLRGGGGGDRPSPDATPSRVGATTTSAVPTSVASPVAVSVPATVPPTAPAPSSTEPAQGSGLGATDAGEVAIGPATPATGFDPLLVPGVLALAVGWALRRSLIATTSPR